MKSLPQGARAAAARCNRHVLRGREPRTPSGRVRSVRLVRLAPGITVPLFRLIVFAAAAIGVVIGGSAVWLAQGRHRKAARLNAREAARHSAPKSSVCARRPARPAPACPSPPPPSADAGRLDPASRHAASPCRSSPPPRSTPCSIPSGLADALARGVPGRHRGSRAPSSRDRAAGRRRRRCC